MQDRQLYQQIPGITSPWTVDRVESKPEENALNVYLKHAETW